MKLYQRLSVAVAALSLGVCGGVSSSQAQQSGVQPIWANYSVQYVNQFYNPLANPTLIPDNAFLNFTGVKDDDDGTANNVPTGLYQNGVLVSPFSFDYNGNVYSSVNVNVNGWISVGPQNIPITPNNNNNLFTSTQPNNTVAPFWGDHFYRTTEPGYHPSRIQYQTTTVPDPNPTAAPGSVLHTFTVEWKDLNINDKSNPNSIASFQVKIVENPMANDTRVPDNRAIIEFHYGSIGTGAPGATTTITGASVGIEDSVGFTHMNGLFPSSSFNGDSTRLNTTRRTDVWPPAGGLPGRIIQFVPEGRSSLNQWGDGDVSLDQIYSLDPLVRNNQNRFVTLLDADLILQARANNVLLDSVEGRAAFHGDANHNGRVYNPTYGAYFYYVSSYDAAYIMLYLAAKLPVLPWPMPLPVPGYKATDIKTGDIAGVTADAQNARINGNTVLVPITLRGQVNGALGLEMNVATHDASALQFIGTRGVDGTLIHANAATGKVVLGASGDFENGATIGYLEFNVTNKQNAEFDMTNVTVNDEAKASSTVSLHLESANEGSMAVNELEHNSPNPFAVAIAGHTSIGFTLASSENVTLRVYDMLGHEIRTLVANDLRSAGHNSIDWDGRDQSGNIVSSGLYYYQIVTPSFTQTVKMQVVR